MLSVVFDNLRSSALRDDLGTPRLQEEAEMGYVSYLEDILKRFDHDLLRPARRSLQNEKVPPKKGCDQDALLRLQVFLRQAEAIKLELDRLLDEATDPLLELPAKCERLESENQVLKAENERLKAKREQLMLKLEIEMKDWKLERNAWRRTEKELRDYIATLEKVIRETGSFGKLVDQYPQTAKMHK